MDIDWTFVLIVIAIATAICVNNYINRDKHEDEDESVSDSTESEEGITTMDIDSVGEQLREIITDAASQAAEKGVAISTSFKFAEHIQYGAEEQDTLNVTITATPNEIRVQSLLSALKAAKSHIITLQGDDRATNRENGDSIKHAVLDIMDAALKS